MLQLPVRKRIRLQPLNYIGRKAYFITICTDQRRHTFLDTRFSASLLALLLSEASAHSFNLHAYCLMPDHLRFLAEEIEPTSNLLDFLKSFKLKSSRQYLHYFGRILWQTRFYDHTLHSPESLESVARYIWLNPVRNGIVQSPDRYPFLGSFTGWKFLSAWTMPNWRPPWKNPQLKPS